MVRNAFRATIDVYCVKDSDTDILTSEMSAARRKA